MVAALRGTPLVTRPVLDNGHREMQYRIHEATIKVSLTLQDSSKCRAGITMAGGVSRADPCPVRLYSEEPRIDVSSATALGESASHFCGKDSFCVGICDVVT